MAEAPTPRTEITGAALDDRILLMGGFVEGGGDGAAGRGLSATRGPLGGGPTAPIALNHAMSTVADGT